MYSAIYFLFYYTKEPDGFNHSIFIQSQQKKFFMKKTLITLILILSGLSLKSQTFDVIIDNFSNCTVTVTALDGSLNPITGCINQSVAGLGGQFNSTCVLNTAVSFFQVDFGTCNSLIITVGGASVGPFTPLLCCPCSNITMSAFSVTPANCNGGTFHVDIH